MVPTEGPKRYKLEALLRQAIQPFPDMDDEKFEELKLSIKQTGLQDPISLTADGSIMWDGNQRCRALLAIGRHSIVAEDTRRTPGVTPLNVWERAVTKNSVRRNLTSEDKAKAMHTMAGRGWGQRKIAKAFGMSQPAVSKLMAKYGPAEGTDTSDTTTGEDGKTYKRKGREGRDAVHPWAPGGDVGKAFRKTWAAMSGWSAATVRAELDERQWSEMHTLINESIDAATRWVTDPKWLGDDE
jgi:hypothetical protein